MKNLNKIETNKGSKLELCIYIAEHISDCLDYQKRIINDLYVNYSINRLKNAACEYTELTLKDVNFYYNVN